MWTSPTSTRPALRIAPHIDLLVDATVGHSLLSFMDAYSEYNQIRMYPRDEEKTSFITDRATYCYRVMPFGLKNAGATYQRAMTAIFHDMLHQNVEDYVDDIVIKTKQGRQHKEDLRQVFSRCRKFKLRMNPLKCAFGVTTGKFLGFMVHHRGIDIDPSKAQSIMGMPPPTSQK